LNLQGNVKIEGFFFNSGSLKVRPAATLDLNLVNCFSNTGTLITEGKIIRSLEPKPGKRKNAEYLSKIEIAVTDETFNVKALDGEQTTEKSLAGIN
jgi:hypothetical protein